MQFQKIFRAKDGRRWTVLKGGRTTTDSPLELTIENMRKASSDAHVIIHHNEEGGRILYSKDFRDAVEEIAKKGTKIDIILEGGVLVSEKIMDYLRWLGQWYSCVKVYEFGLDYHIVRDPEVEEYIRSRDEGYPRPAGRIEHCRKGLF